MRSDHLSKHIKRCQNRESTTRAASIINDNNKADQTQLNPIINNGQCTAIDCNYSPNCLQCQNDQKQFSNTFESFALPQIPLTNRRNALPPPPSPPSPPASSCPAFFYSHHSFNQNFQPSLNQLTQQANLPISTTAQCSSLLPSNNPFNVFSLKNFENINQKLNNHTIDNLIFKPNPFTPSAYIINEDSCSSLPPQLQFKF